MPNWFSNKQPAAAISEYSVLGLTGAGIKKAESFPQGAAGQVISTLHFGNGCNLSVDEIAERTGMSLQQIIQIAQSNKAFIQVV